MHCLHGQVPQCSCSLGDGDGRGSLPSLTPQPLLIPQAGSGSPTMEHVTEGKVQDSLAWQCQHPPQLLHLHLHLLHVHLLGVRSWGRMGSLRVWDHVQGLCPRLTSCPLALCAWLGKAALPDVPGLSPSCPFPSSCARLCTVHWVQGEQRASMCVCVCACTRGCMHV